MERQDIIIHSKNKSYDGFFKIFTYALQHPLYQGGQSEMIYREVFHREPAAAVLAHDPKARKILLLKQFRIGAFHAGIQPEVLECIAGIIDPGIHVEDTLRKESKEEAGIRLERLQFVSRELCTPGGSSETLDFYLGEFNSTDFEVGIYGETAEGENILAELYDYDTVFDWSEQGLLHDSKTSSLVKTLQIHELKQKIQTLSPACPLAKNVGSTYD